MERLKSLYTEVSPDYTSLAFAGGRFFALKTQPPKLQPFLVVMEDLDDETNEKVVVDPNSLDPSGGVSIDFYVPSHDGRKVAVSLSKGGSENGTVHVYEVEEHQQLADKVHRVNYPTGGGSVAWNPNGDGFWYTRYPAESERSPEDLHFYQQVYFHRIGTDSKGDAYAIGKEFPRIAEVQLKSARDSLYVLATVANGDGGEFAHFLMDPRGRWTQVTQFKDKASLGSLGHDGYLYLLSRKDAPKGMILKLPLSRPELRRAKVVVKEGTSSITRFVTTKSSIAVICIDGGPSTVAVYDLEGASHESVGTEPVSDVSEALAADGDLLLLRCESFVTPPAWYAYERGDLKTRKIRLEVKPSADFSDCEVVREFATSKDGTLVPMSIIRRKGIRLDGNNPALMTGYGGYGLSISPYFRSRRRLWIDRGGIYVVANVRGGGEYGEGWHFAGNLTRKQNVFDDFIACAQHLIKEGYTSPSLLAIEGGSNGGILMAACLTQRPDLFRVVVSRVGIYDMLRVECDPNGEFNTTEFGTVKNREQFRALYAYSPYHKVREGEKYPSILMPAGEHDGRVNPANSRKMVAALQYSSSSGNPVLLRWSGTSGHGIGTALDEQINADADAFSFIFSEMGL
jgi:prolyl oligopeptidase